MKSIEPHQPDGCAHPQISVWPFGNGRHIVIGQTVVRLPTAHEPRGICRSHCESTGRNDPRTHWQTDLSDAQGNHKFSLSPLGQPIKTVSAPSATSLPIKQALRDPVTQICQARRHGITTRFQPPDGSKLQTPATGPLLVGLSSWFLKIIPARPEHLSCCNPLQPDGL